MKAIVLGGAGDMGSRAVEDLAASDGVSRVTIADRNTQAAARWVDRLRGSKPKVDQLQVDANDHDALLEALRGYDVAASALGPFYRFEAKLVRAALEAGVDYVSICDEWEPAELVLQELDSGARQCGRTVVTGLGASPGVTNLGFAYLAAQFERVEKAEIYVYQPLTAGGGEAVVRHMLHIMTGEVCAWRGGRRVMVAACSEQRSVEFPRYGSLKLWNMGHSEPYTLPRSVPELQEVGFFMGYGSGAELLVWPAAWGLFANRYASEAVVGLAGFLERVLPSRPPSWGALRVDVWGRRGAVTERRMLCGIGEMRETTGLALSIGAQLVAQGKTCGKGPGVYPPEACIDPLQFMRAMKERGILSYEDLAMEHPLEG